MRSDNSGFSLLEMMVVSAIIGIVAAIAIPQALSALKGYRLHSDATSIASYVNLARMRSASQYAPYRLVVNIAAGTYWMEKLCGITTTTTDPACTSPYAAYTTPQLEFGTQYTLQGDIFLSCRPAFITGTAYPATITGDLSPCPDPVYMYFNTRGAPVDNTGNPLGNGGAVVYVINQNNLVDAVSTSLGGRAAAWAYSPNSTSWVMR